MATRMVVKKRSKLKEELLDKDKKVEKKTVKEEVATTPSEEVVVRRKKKKKSNKTENIVLAALIIILFACFAAIGFLFYKYFYAGASSNKYGDRLDGIENYPLSSTLEDDIKSLYSEEKSVNKVVVHVQGKIVYIDIDFSEAVKIETAESLASKSLEKIGEENLKFYDVQYILSYSGEEENENFPIFGAKKSTSTKIVWSKVK
jgi:hypothetical protein